MPIHWTSNSQDGLYGALPYVLSTFVSYLPVNIIGPGIYAIIST